MSHFLKRINSTLEAPLESYLLYNLTGGLFYIDPKHYPAFILQWVGSTQLPPLTMDLCSIRAHSLILDFDCHDTQISTNILEIIESTLKITFIPNVPNFTYIIASRKNGAGIHVHLPEFIIGHDDYILFCECLQYKIQSLLKNENSYTLDILKNAMLMGASKPNTEPYCPVQLVYVDETNTINLPLNNLMLDSKPPFKRLKSNEKSLFRYLLNCKPNSLLLQLKYVMMPLVINFQPHYHILYQTTISNTQSDNLTVVAAFTNNTHDINYITKSKQLTINESQILKVYYYLKLNAPRIVEMETNNYAISQWYKKFHTIPTENSNIPERFLDIHLNLQLDNPVFANDPNPIKSILEYNNGYYFLPVFYTFCQYFQTTPAHIVQDFFQMVDVQYHPLLRRIQELDHKTIDYGVTDLTLNTLHFCANNLYNRPQSMKEKLKLILDHNIRSILSVTTHGQMIELLRNIQEKHFPIRVLKLRNALKKPSRYIWNFLTESWQEITHSGEITDHLFNLWTVIKNFLVQYKKSGGTGGPDDNIVEKFNVNTVVSAIISDTAIERKDILMDAHKWFIRLQDGTLHLLTGHIGGVVPEFFLSDRKVGVELSRVEMITLCNSSVPIENLYHSMTDRSIFLKYLKALLIDDQQDFYEALQNILPTEQNSLMTSMMHFYINLCKYTSFDYDLLMYLMDVLASVLIATNYERKFFVLKGLTRNGKSKLFELMGRILGGYYHSIQSENLTPGHSTNTATPELASTLFSCRMVASEELEGKLHENRVKQITGNSFVTFRNMYEQNSGGIPTAKLFVTTNNYPECNASAAFKDRVVAIPFDAVFTNNAPNTTSEQVIANTFLQNSYVVEESYQGGFFMLYYHLKHNISPNDGLLHYRPEPPSVIEFTEDYLIHADIYVQFKIHMDVQIVSGCMTTMNDVKSAVRQFLKGTKNTAFHETDLFMSFEEEFGEYRRTDVQLNSFNYVGFAEKSSPLQNESLQLSEESSESKKSKTEGSFFVYYESVVIKNMKRTNLDM